MNFIWDIVLNAKSMGQKRKNSFFALQKKAPPGMSSRFQYSMKIGQKDQKLSTTLSTDLMRYSMIYCERTWTNHQNFKLNCLTRFPICWYRPICTMAYPSGSIISAGCLKNWRKVNMVQQ